MKQWTAHSEMWMWTRRDFPAVLAVNTNSLIHVRFLDVSWVRVLEHHHLTYIDDDKLCHTQQTSPHTPTAGCWHPAGLISWFHSHCPFYTDMCLKKTGPLWLIWYNFTNSQRLLIIFGPFCEKHSYSVLWKFHGVTVFTARHHMPTRVTDTAIPSVRHVPVSHWESLT